MNAQTSQSSKNTFFVAGYQGRLDRENSNLRDEIKVFSFTLKNGLAVELELRPHLMKTVEAQRLVPDLEPEYFGEFDSVYNDELVQEHKGIFEDALGQQILIVRCPDLNFEQTINPGIIEEATVLPAIFENLESKKSAPIGTEPYLHAMYTKDLLAMFEQAPKFEALRSDGSHFSAAITSKIFTQLIEDLTASASQDALRGFPLLVHRTNFEKFARIALEIGDVVGPQGKAALDHILKSYLPGGFAKRVNKVMQRANQG